MGGVHLRLTLIVTLYLLAVSSDGALGSTCGSTTTSSGNDGGRKHLKLGLITPPANGGKVSYDRVAAATTMAMEQAVKDGYLGDVDVE